MATDISKTESKTVTPKKNNSKLFIIIGVAVSVLLCICSIVAILILAKPNTDDEQGFIDLLNRYNTISDQIDDKWDTDAAACDSSEEYKEKMSTEYYEEELPQLYIDIEALVEDQWACYDDIRQYELNLDKSLLAEFEEIDCNKVKQPSKCEDFIDTYQALVTNQEDTIEVISEVYKYWKEDDVCYLDALRDNFGNKPGQDAADELCAKNSVDLSDKRDPLEDEYSELVDELSDFVDEYLAN